jgi:glutamine cyclotransferase
VPNGIAYDSAARRILVTGKRWAGVYVVDVR